MILASLVVQRRQGLSLTSVAVMADPIATGSDRTEWLQAHQPEGWGW